MRGYLTILLLLSASTVQAETHRFDLKPLIATAAGQLSDAAVTHHQITTPDLHCVESNPHLGPHPSAATLILPKLALIGVVALAQVAGSKAKSETGRHVSRAIGYFTGALGGTLAVRNLKTCGW